MSSEPDSFDEFFRCHLTPVIGYLVKRGFGIEDAHEAASEAMLRAYKAWPLDYPRPWVYTTAKRIVEKKPRRDLDGIKKAIDAGWDEPWLIDPFLEAEVNDHTEVLTLLSELTDAQRTVVVWRMYDFAPSEIASLTGVTEATVRAHLRDARARLRPHFEAAKLNGRSIRHAPKRKEVIDDVE